MNSRRLQRLEQQLNPSSPDERQEAIEGLERSRHASALQVLFETSRNPDHAANTAADEVFARIVEVRPRRAMRHRNPAIRRRAIELSETSASPVAVAELGRVLKTDSQEAIRCLAAEALGQIAEPRCVNGLVAARRDLSREVRLTALTALSRISAVNAERAMTRFLNDEDWTIRQQACEFLESAGWQPQTPQERTVSAIVHDRFDEAIRHGESSSQALLHATLHGEDADTRRWAAIALQRVSDRTAREKLTASLDSPQPAVRQAAAEAIRLLWPAREMAVPADAGEKHQAGQEMSVFAAAIRMLALAGEA